VNVLDLNGALALAEGLKDSELRCERQEHTDLVVALML